MAFFRATQVTGLSAIVELDDHLRVRSCNADFLDLFGVSRTTALGAMVEGLDPPGSAATGEQPRADLDEQPQRVDGALRADTTSDWTPVTDREGWRALVADLEDELAEARSALQEVATERQGMERELDHLALHDTITGLPNRFLFEERVRQALAEAEAEPVGVAVVQVVGLDTLIDREGLVEGELTLSEIARRLSALLADDMSLAHLQPGQFAVLVKGGTQEMVRASELALDAVRRPIFLPSGSVTVRAKVGICAAMAGPECQTARAGSLIQDATIASGRATADGVDSIAFALPEMRKERQERHEAELVLRDALANDRIRVAFQPLVDLSSGLVVGAEALLRVSNRDGHLIPPEMLISVAEESGLISEVGRRVLKLSAEQASRWLTEQGLLLPVAVNVSAVQLATPTFLDDVLGAARSAGVPPEALSIELTESVLVEAGSVGVEKLRDLRDAGVQLAIDDFGTGYASLTYLRDLPASTVKIDRSFVEGIPHDRAAVAIVAAVIALARNFEMACIAEGIETEAQLAYLQDRGVLGQGYLLGRPQDGAEISRMLDRARSASRLDAAQDSLELELGAGAGHDELSRARRHAGSRRGRQGEEREARAGRRDAQADVRDQAGDRRDAEANSRDAEASRRDQAADRRDAASDARDGVIVMLGRDTNDPSRAEGEDGSTGAPLSRRGAARDRGLAEKDRMAAAKVRRRAGQDRIAASTDREAGAHERLQAQLDRNIALADRGYGDQDRAGAEDHGVVEQAHRTAASTDRRTIDQ